MSYRRVPQKSRPVVVLLGMMAWTLRVCCLGAACFAWGCGGSSGTLPEAGTADTGTKDVGAPDAGHHDSSMPDTSMRDVERAESAVEAAGYPAFMPAMPQIVGGTIPVISAPVVTPVYFSGETLQTDLDGMLTTWLASKYFAGSVSEYGVKSGSAGTSIVEGTYTPPITLMDTDVESWLSGELDGTHSEFGAVDATTLASEIFVLYYPAATMISLGTATSCTDFNGYHAGVALGTGAVANYVVIPRCAPGTGETQTDELTGVLSSLVVSAATDPIPSLTPTTTGFASFDALHLAFGVYGGEVGTASPCETLDTVTPAGLPHAIVRTWSNVAASAYMDPCVPAPTGPYFIGVPVATSDSVTVPLGKTVTVDVQLLSSAKTSGPWTVKTASAEGSTSFTYSVAPATGVNGDTLKLTITAPATATKDIAVLASSSGATTNALWFLAVKAM
jgi:hypothetical protein